MMCPYLGKIDSPCFFCPSPCPKVDKDARQAAGLARDPCGPECDHSQAEHDAFDAGLEAGEAGTPADKNPHSDITSLREAWDSGHSVGNINREHDAE